MVSDRVRVELIREISLKDFGEISVFPGDINGDGKIELVFPQGVDGPKPAPSTGFYPHEKTIHCVTAIDLEGNILWQNGTPIGASHRKYHGRGPTLVHDLDGDGSAEIVYVTAAEYNRPRLRMLRGASGELVRDVETWASWDIIPVNFRGLGKRDLVLGDALWLVFAYTDTFEPIWKWHRYYGGGHHHCAEDIDGKGVDDLFIGISRINAKGDRVWWRPDLDGVLEHMRCAPHMDKVEVRRMHAGSGDWQVIWIGGADIACLDAADGNLRWRFSGNHLHNYAIGRFDPSSRDQMVYIAEAHRFEHSWLLSADGKVKFDAVLGPGMARCVRNAGPDRSDLLIVSAPRPGERPYVMAPDGRKLAELSNLPPAADLPKADGKGHDSGRAFHIDAYDIDQDGIDEILAYNRERLLLFKVSS